MTAHIVTQRTVFGIPFAVSCRALGVSESWFYKHRDRPPTPASVRRRELDETVATVFAANAGEYGSPRVHADLIERPAWTRLSVNTVASSMRRQRLRAKVRPRRRSLTRPDAAAPKFANLLQRDFDPPAPNVAWCGDMTEVRTWEGKLYLATVIDLYSRRILGFAISEDCQAAIVSDAMRMAVATRAGQVAGVVFHSDRGAQYTSRDFVGLCHGLGVTQSMSRSGSCLDNAVAESWFATLKTEFVYRVALPTRTNARVRLAAWIHRYNQDRRHSRCGWKSPITYEKMTTRTADAA